jgi:hypothetical protein
MVNHLAIRDREIKRIQAETREMISACFRQAVRQVGEVETRRIWHEIAKRPGGKSRGTTDKTRDDSLLSHYDEWVHHHPERQRGAPALIGKHLATSYPGRYGPSAPAITRHLRRLLSRRPPPGSGTWNALAVLERTGRLPVGEPPWETDK